MLWYMSQYPIVTYAECYNNTLSVISGTAGRTRSFAHVSGASQGASVQQCR